MMDLSLTGGELGLKRQRGICVSVGSAIRLPGGAIRGKAKRINQQNKQVVVNINQNLCAKIWSRWILIQCIK